MFKKNFLFYSGFFSVILFFFIFIYSFYYKYYSNYTIIDDSLSSLSSSINISSNGFAWPIPGYNNITSYFGYRQASSVVSAYHSGIDIGAPTGTYFVAICDGTIVNARLDWFWWLYYYIYK